jgi:hypothetical protein
MPVCDNFKTALFFSLSINDTGCAVMSKIGPRLWAVCDSFMPHDVHKAAAFVPLNEDDDATIVIEWTTTKVEIPPGLQPGSET